MASGETLDGLIDRIYAAALFPETWRDVVAEVGSTIGATSATSLWFGEGGTQLLQAHVWNIDPDALVEYQQHYLAFCPRYRASPAVRPAALCLVCGSGLATDQPRTRHRHHRSDSAAHRATCPALGVRPDPPAKPASPPHWPKANRPSK